MDRDLHTEELFVDGQAVLVVRGEIDMATAPQFEAACRQVATRTGRLIIDLSAVEFMDSSGLSFFVRAHNEPTIDSVEIRNPSAQIQRLLEIAGLAELFIEARTDSARAAGPDDH